MQKKLEVIDTIKVLMMMTVVLYHCCMFFTGNWFDVVSPVYKAGYISALARYLNTFHVPTFTMASGYLFYCLRIEQDKYQDNAISDIKQRARRLLFPYFTTLLVWVIPYDLVFNGFDKARFMHNFALGFSPAQLWFLSMLFWIFILFYFAFKKVSVTTKGIVCVALISIGGGVLPK